MAISRRASAAVCAAALVDALAVAFVVPRSAPLVTTYAQASSAASALELGAGLALLAAGIVAWHERAGGSLGPLAVLIGLVWLAQDWVGWEDGWPPARSVAMLALPFAPALLLHVALAAPRGRMAGAAPLPALAYAAAALVSAGLALFRDPFADPYCWSNCSDNVLLVHSDIGLAHTLGVLAPAVRAGTGLLVVAVAGWRLGTATGAGRRAAWPVLAAAALAGAAEAAYGAALLRTPLEDPGRAGFMAVFAVRAVALIALAAAVAWTALRARRVRAALARIRAESAPLRELLARALGDPGVLVAYPLPGSARLVDATGAPVAPPNGRATTRIERGGETVALVTHDAALLDGPALEREIGAAARLAVDNERLRASVLARVEDLRASRRRIVETGDAARRRLERDLHDGAQQRLLALSYELRLAHAGEAALEETRLALEELRELAHGIHPAILAEAGLEPALATLADTAAIPVRLGPVTPDRHPVAVETAAYLVAVHAVEDAARRGASYAALELARDAETLVLTVTDDGRGARAPADHLADRAGALGGRLDAGPNRIEARIPCA